MLQLTHAHTTLYLFKNRIKAIRMALIPWYRMYSIIPPSLPPLSMLKLAIYTHPNKVPGMQQQYPHVLYDCNYCSLEKLDSPNSVYCCTIQAAECFWLLDNQLLIMTFCGSAAEGTVREMSCYILAMRESLHNRSWW